MKYRIIFYHKQATSARTRFLKFKYNSVCAPEAMPKLAQITDSSIATLIHPSSVIAEVAQKYGLEKNEMEAEGEFVHHVEVPGEIIQIILIRITSIDPPFDVAEANNAEFVELMKTFGLPPVEMELLRHAYELIMGG